MGIGVLAGRRAALERWCHCALGGAGGWVSYTDAPAAAAAGGGANVAGAGAAAGFIEQVGCDTIDAQVTSLRAHAVAGLSVIDGIRVLATDSAASAIVSFVADGVHPRHRRCWTNVASPCAPPVRAAAAGPPGLRADDAPRSHCTTDEVERRVGRARAAGATAMTPVPTRPICRRAHGRNGVPGRRRRAQARPRQGIWLHPRTRRAAATRSAATSWVELDVADRREHRFRARLRHLPRRRR
jgi:hypothetical protein